jgi:hypothetical protein
VITGRQFYTACVVALLVAVCSDADAQTPARATPARPVIGTGLIAGTVMTDETPSAPVRRALVTLTGAPPGARQVVTEDDGRFAFPALPAGLFMLTVEKPGYVKTYFGARRPWHPPGIPAALTDGQRITGVIVKMPRGAVIAGRIRDEFGAPLSSAQVSPRQIVFVNGERRLVNVPGVDWATTDDRGEYRLYGLPPGDYVVAAGASIRSAGPGGVQQVTQSEIDAAQRELAGVAVTASNGAVGQPIDAPTVMRGGVYAPGVSEAADAQVFTLAAGDERTGVDIVSPLMLAGRIDGISLGPDGQPLRNVSVGIANLSQGSMYYSPGLIRPGVDGRFLVANVGPGRYLFYGRSTASGEPSNPSLPLQYWTQAEVTVAGATPASVTLQFLPGVSVAGHLTFRETTPSNIATLRLSLDPVPVVAGASVPPTRVNAAPDGTFTFTGVPGGKYRVSATGLAGFSLRSAEMEGHDILDAPLEIAPGQDVSGLTLTFIDHPAEITGILRDSLGRPTPAYSIAAFATDRNLRGTSPRRFSGIVRAASDGRYRIVGLPPGTYYVAVLPDVDPAELNDPSFLDQLAPSALTLQLGEGEQKVQDFQIATQ